MFIHVQPSSHQDGRCCGWTARSWRGWESSRRHWGRRSFSKSSSCKSGKKSATCSSLAEVSLSVWACICACVCACERTWFCLFLSVIALSWETERRVDFAMTAEELGCAKWEEGSLRACAPAVTYVEVDVKAQLLVTVCSFIDGSSWFAALPPSDGSSKHFYYPAINTLTRSQLTWIQQFDVDFFLWATLKLSQLFVFCSHHDYSLPDSMLALDFICPDTDF